MSLSTGDLTRSFWEHRYRENPDLGSGVGSKDFWRARKLRFVERFICTGNIRSILDLGCGDLQVMGALKLPDGITYTGIDFSEQVVARNRERFPHYSFISADLGELSSLKLPTPDLIVCLDVLFHIGSDSTYDRVLEYLCNAGAKAILLTAVVTEERPGLAHVFHRDFWKASERLGLKWALREEEVFRLPHERLMAFSREDIPLPSETSEGTEIVYVCSSDYVPMVELSLRSLLASGSEFDRISIYLTGQIPTTLEDLPDSVTVKAIDPLLGDYFYGNKLFVCESQYGRAIFLDADTLVLKPLQRLYEGTSADLLARPGSASALPGWDEQSWQSTFRKLRLGPPVPMLNAGVLVFQNGAHARIQPHWADYIEQYRQGNLPHPSNDLRMFEQWSLSLAVSKSGLEVMTLSENEHAFGWRADCADEAVVFHTGGRLFDRLTTPFRPFPRDEESKRAALRAVARTQLEDALSRISALEQRVSTLRAASEGHVSVGDRLRALRRFAAKKVSASSILRRVSMRLAGQARTGPRRT
jgi:SAM-dependent methyltransferase